MNIHTEVLAPDGVTAGTARIGPPHDNFGPWVGQLHELTVAKGHRGRGVGWSPDGHTRHTNVRLRRTVN